MYFYYFILNLFMTQYKMDCLSQGWDNFGLTVSTKKAAATYQPAPGNQEPHIMVKGQNVQAVDNFTYLGSTGWRVVCINADVNNRIGKASIAFGRLCEDVWERKGISLSTKLKVYHA